MSHLINSQKNSRLGKLLLDRGWVDQKQLSQALEYQAQHQCRLGESLLALGLINQKQLNKVLCRQRWLRSFIAGIVMISTPVCPVLANEKPQKIKFTAQAIDHSDKKLFPRKTFNPKLSLHDPSQLEIQHNLTQKYGVEFAFGQVEFDYQVPSNEIFYSQISLFRSRPVEELSLSSLKNKKKHQRFDRYKNTIPTVYRLTLKGYSIFEQSEDKMHFWRMDKVKDSPYKKYELMFSVTKQF